MGSVVQARLDQETKAALDKLVRQRKMSVSEVLREGIRLVEERQAPLPRRKVIGVGGLKTGILDLATNPKHMEGFGQDRLKRGNRR